MNSTPLPPLADHGSIRRPIFRPVVFGWVAVVALAATVAAVIQNRYWAVSVRLTSQLADGPCATPDADAMVRAMAPCDPARAADWQDMNRSEGKGWSALIARHPEVMAYRWAEWRREFDKAGQTPYNSVPHDEASRREERMNDPVPHPLTPELRSAIETRHVLRTAMTEADRDNGWIPLIDAVTYAHVSVGNKHPKDGRTEDNPFGKTKRLGPERTARIPNPGDEGFIDQTYYLNPPPNEIYRVVDPARAAMAARLLHDAVRRPRFTQEIQDLYRRQSALFGNGEGPGTLPERLAFVGMGASEPLPHLQTVRDLARRLTGEIERRAYREAGRPWPPVDAWSMEESPEAKTEEPAPAAPTPPEESEEDIEYRTRYQAEKKADRERALASDVVFLDRWLPVDPAVDYDRDGLSAEDVALDIQTVGARLMVDGGTLIEQLVGIAIITIGSENGARVFRSVGDDATAERLLARGRRLSGRYLHSRVRDRLLNTDPEQRTLGELQSDPALIAAAFAPHSDADAYTDRSDLNDEAIRSGGILFAMLAPALGRVTDNPAARPTWEEIRQCGWAEYVGIVPRAMLLGSLILLSMTLLVLGPWWFAVSMNREQRLMHRVAPWPSLWAMLAMGAPAAFFALMVPMVSRWDYLLPSGIATLWLFPLWGLGTAAWWLTWMSRCGVLRDAYRFARQRAAADHPLSTVLDTGELETLQRRTWVAGLAWITTALPGLAVAAWRMGPGRPDPLAPPEAMPTTWQGVLLLGLVAAVAFGFVDGVLFLGGRRSSVKGTDFLMMGRLRYTVGGTLVWLGLTAGVLMGMDSLERQASREDVLVSVRPDDPWISMTGVEARVVGLIATEARRALAEEEEATAPTTPRPAR